MQSIFVITRSPDSEIEEIGRYLGSHADVDAVMIYQPVHDPEEEDPKEDFEIIYVLVHDGTVNLSQIEAHANAHPGAQVLSAYVMSAGWGCHQCREGCGCEEGAQVSGGDSTDSGKIESVNTGTSGGSSEPGTAAEDQE